MKEPTRSRLLHQLAGACVLLMLLVVGASGWLRLSQPRPACSDWPACHAAVRPAVAPGVTLPGLADAVRGLHRVTASLALLASLALAWLALGLRPRRRDAGRVALALVGIALLLAALGIVTPGSRSRAVLLGNLLGGHLMLALAWRLLRHLRPPAALPPGGAAPAAALLLLAQAALGAQAGAGGAAAVLHLALAGFALTLLAWTGFHARRHGRAAEGRALLGVAAAQGLLGGIAAGLATNGLTSPMVLLAHNLGAAMALALLIGLMPAAASPRPATT